MINYTLLENIHIDILHKAFILAFSDYQVKSDIPFSKFENMLIRRGYESKISIGAFKQDNLVGFIYNGLRVWNNKKTAYDTGTGVIKEYRKQGITTTMFNNLKKELIENNVEYYLLEVLKTNTAAFELYKKQGFRITREFNCFKLDKCSYSPTNIYNIENKPVLTEKEWNEVKDFWDITPSWQNSIDSINSTIDSFIFSLVKDNNKIIGYGIIDKNTGDIPQIAVHHEYRNKGIGKSIITNLIENTKADIISVINVDASYTPMIQILSSIGFKNFIGQYEMLLELKN